MIKLQLEDCGTCYFNIDNYCPIWEDATACGDWCDYYGEYIDMYDTCLEYKEVNHE